MLVTAIAFILGVVLGVVSHMIAANKGEIYALGYIRGFQDAYEKWDIPPEEEEE